MLWRNRDLQVLLAACLGTTAALAVAALATAGAATATWVLIAGLVVTALSAAGYARRTRRLAELASRMEDALATGRRVSFEDMHEGEEAVLSSQAGKTLDALQLTNERLAAEKASLADSLADVSHQLRTPITSLGLELELARRDAAEPAARAHLMRAEQLRARMAWLVEALLKLARIDAGVVVLDRRDMVAAELVDRAIAPLGVALDLADVRLRLHVDPVATAHVDPAWTAEALENVVKNCIEHTPAGGTVTITATQDLLACRIRVEDTGPGIAPQDLPHMFERFYRGAADKGATGDKNATSATNPAGVGIGLSLARAIVVAEDGHLTATNATAQDGTVTGARFDFAFYRATV